MAQTPFVKTTVPNPNNVTGIALVWAACDTTNGNSITLTGTEIALVYNSTTGALTFAITGAPDPYGRTTNFSMSVPASVSLAAAPSVIMTPRLGTALWGASGGTTALLPSSNSAALFVAVLTG